MPTYNYKCEICDHIDSKTISISEYSKIRNNKINCPECKRGVLFQQVASISSTVERGKEETIQQIKEDAAKIVEKVKSGNEQTIRDVYGETQNKYKYG